jgi:hypothetical protein
MAEMDKGLWMYHKAKTAAKTTVGLAVGLYRKL